MSLKKTPELNSTEYYNYTIFAHHCNFLMLGLTFVRAVQFDWVCSTACYSLQNIGREQKGTHFCSVCTATNKFRVSHKLKG
jgi:hypothetical protein